MAGNLEHYGHFWADDKALVAARAAHGMLDSDIAPQRRATATAAATFNRALANADSSDSDQYVVDGEVVPLLASSSSTEASSNVALPPVESTPVAVTPAQFGAKIKAGEHMTKLAARFRLNNRTHRRLLAPLSKSRKNNFTRRKGDKGLWPPVEKIFKEGLVPRAFVQNAHGVFAATEHAVAKFDADSSKKLDSDNLLKHLKDAYDACDKPEFEAHMAIYKGNLALL